ncbi:MULTISPECIES: hypothetical protein [Mesorhizobium]|uniref:hypothetical protein n=1 Tax=Mesorhizobium sp. TaxID=1871066 RepID=UPI003335357B
MGLRTEQSRRHPLEPRQLWRRQAGISQGDRILRERQAGLYRGRLHHAYPAYRPEDRPGEEADRQKVRGRRGRRLWRQLPACLCTRFPIPICE